MKKIFKYWYVGFFAFIILMQFVQPDKNNPQVNPTNDITNVLQADENVKVILKKACYDCHSNETKWPWYSYIAPISFLVAHDVNEGREHLNFSEYGNYSLKRRIHKLEEITEQVSANEMPLPIYLPMHPEAKLTKDEINILTNWSESEFIKFNEPD